MYAKELSGKLSESLSPDSNMLFEHKTEELFTLNRSDTQQPLSSYALFAFELDGAEWPSVEHYYQAMKFEDEAHREKIRQAKTAEEAAKLGKSRKPKRRKDWKKTSTVVMTRGTYIKCRTHRDIAEQLLETGELRIAELSGYDYFWGSGRDMRGKNNFGKVLMGVRDKLRSEREQSA